MKIERDSLLNLINHTVVKIYQDKDDYWVILFDNGSKIQFSSSAQIYDKFRNYFQECV